jgi:ribosomal protein S18 acetylase RimI-like enzyme
VSQIELEAGAVSLELGRDGFYPRIRTSEEMEAVRLSSTAIQFAGFLWHAAGQDCWPARHWSDADWFERLCNIEVGFYGVSCRGEPVGLFELSKASEVVRIEAIGLLPTYRGVGLAQGLLTTALEKGFAMGGQVIRVFPPAGIDQNVLAWFRSQGFR